MENKNMLLTIGIILCMLLFSSIITINPTNKIKESVPQNTLDFNKFSKLSTIYSSNGELRTTNTLENGTGCSSVIVHVKPGHDVISYRRDSGYSADIIINKINFNGQNAIKEYKIQNGYFTHTIITANGWIISIGGKDDPNTNKQLEQLGSDIMSDGNIKKKDIDKANLIIRGNGWGHFVIKSPNDDVGITAYDFRVSSSIIKLFKMDNGDYVKVPNNPRYYSYGKFNKFSDDPTDAAINIVGKDIYGQDRRDVITYDYYNDNNLAKVDVWASFDGGALLGRIRGKPDNIQYMGNKIMSNELPKIPGKKFLGEMLQDINNFDVNLIFDNQRMTSALNTPKNSKFSLNQ